MTVNLAGFSLTDHELDAVLTDIDNELRNEGGPIRGREIRGWMSFAAKFQLEGLTWQHPISVRVFRWFDALYGDRLKVDFFVGLTVADIRQDIYQVRIVRIYGTIHLICDPMLFGASLGPKLVVNGRPSANLLDYVVGMTPALAKTLTEAECNNLVQVYVRAFLALSRVEEAVQATFAKEGLADLRQSAVHLANRNPEWGLSNWASLQATEKLLKSFIVTNGEQPDRNHNLLKLAAKASALGLPPIPPESLEAVQCTAEVRYDSDSVTKQKAVAAHYNALSICGEIAYRLVSTPTWISMARRIGYSVNGAQRPIDAMAISRVKK